MKTLIFLISLVEFLFILSGCGFDEPTNTEWDIDLYVQKIEGTSKLLYKYNGWGVRDTHISGYKILDSTEKFQVTVNTDLRFTDLLEIPNKKFIRGISTDFANSNSEDYQKTIPIFTPIKIENIKKQDFEITNFIYQYRGFSEKAGGLESFQFEKFKEIRDSIFFYNLDDVESENGKHLNSLKLKKTDVCVAQNKNHEVIRIVFEDLVVDKNSNKIISNVTYYLKPKNKLNSNQFSDYGIFKEIVK